MTVIAGIGFTAPWLLLGLLALPVLWLLLRAVPPAPRRVAFPGVSLLLGLRDDDSISDRTPWWLLLLRMLAVAAAIIGLAGPVLNPRTGQGGSGPLLFVLDGSWAGADDWPKRIAVLDTQLEQAARDGRPVAVLNLTAPQPVAFQPASALRARLPGLLPAPWQPDTQAGLDAISASDRTFDSHWLGDGLEYAGRADLLQALQARGAVTVFQSDQPVLGLRPAGFQDGAVQLTALRAGQTTAQTETLLAMGPDPSGTTRVLARAELTFDAGADQAQAALALPSELRARVTRFVVDGTRSAGAVTLSDDSLRRREVALITGQRQREGLELLSPLHYLTQVLSPTAEFVQGTILEVVPANPDVIVLADVVALGDGERAALTDWIERGGLLLRFAGPRMAASPLGREAEDPLLPVRLRGGGRTVGGAMSWGEAKTLAPFPETSPFYGLQPRDEVTVSSQVLAQPDPDLADRVIAALSDGTPLVTRKPLGLGQVVLFHVTADAEWSSLPLSGLFVEMLDRLAVSSAAKTPQAVALEGTTWRPLRVLDAFGQLRDAGTLPGVAGADLISAPLGPRLPPGVYETENRRIARNVLGPDAALIPANWPGSVPLRGFDLAPQQAIGGLLLALALLLLMADIIAALALGGRLPMRQKGLAVLLLALAWPAVPSHAQDADRFALDATSELALAHVLTGDARIDATAQAGLLGLSDTLYFRTTVEPSQPIGVDLERDELAFFPLLYWPITPDQPQPSDAAYARLNAYLRSGGMILFDTRDGDIARAGGQGPNGRALQRLAAPLDIPPLEVMPDDHVLTRTFYLLQDAPGRHAARDIWVEAAPPDAEQIEGMPFRNLNDGVTPVVIGGNDWASAWAIDRDGAAMYPVGRGFAGERQRELAYRFGVNLIMHVLTGNYKSDQVHVPALLDRLGQ